MPLVVALAGLSGAGKTTAISMLEARGCGIRFYVGGIVTGEMRRRGLKGTPSDERLVREELRRDGGMDALARLALPAIEGFDGVGAVLLDAIYNDEERTLYAGHFGVDFRMIAMEAPFTVRAQRLAMRANRPSNKEDLARRDAYEISSLGIESVLAAADARVPNEGTLDELEGTLQVVFDRLA